MAQTNSGNYDALVWVQDEIQQSLADALTTVTRFIESPDDTSKLVPCINQLGQTHGVIDMLGLTGANLLIREMLASLSVLTNQTSNNTESIADTVLKGLLLLPNYLKLIGHDFEDNPLRLIETINELRTARGEVALSPTNLFKPNFSIVLPDDIALPPQKESATGFTLDKASHAFQISLLQWIKTQDIAGLKKISQIVHYLRRKSTHDRLVILWWVAEGFIEALLDDGLPINSETKLTLGNLNHSIKLFSQDDVQRLMAEYPTDLVKNLLLLIARSTSAGKHVSLLKQVFNLDFYDAQKHQKLYSFSDNALSEVHSALLEQLQEIKEQIDQFDRHAVDAQQTVAMFSDSFNTIADTLDLLTESDASGLLSQQAQQLKRICDSETLPSDEQLLSLANDLLKVENLLRRDSSNAGDSGNDQLQRTVISECLTELLTIKEALTRLENQLDTDQETLPEAAIQMELIAGSLTMLNLREAASLLENTAVHMRDAQNVTTEKLSIFAEVIAAIELYMEGVTKHGQQQLHLLEQAQHKLDQPTPAITSEIEDKQTSPVQGFINKQNEDIDEQFNISETHNLNVDIAPFDIGSETASITHNEQALDLTRKQETTVTPSFAEGIDPEIAEIFIEEANEVLDELATLIPEWQMRYDGDVLAIIRRHFHTLKGSGRMAGASVIGELAWSIESLLNHVIEQNSTISTDVVQLVIDGFEVIPDLLTRFMHADMSSTVEVDTISARANALLNPEQVSAIDSAAQDIKLDESGTEPVLEIDDSSLGLTLEAVAPEPELETISEPQPTSVQRYIDALETKQESVELEFDSDINIEDSAEEHALALDESPFDLTLKAVETEPEFETISEPQPTSVQRYIDALETKQDRLELAFDGDLDIEDSAEEQVLALDDSPFDLTLEAVAAEPELETISEPQPTSVQRYIDALENKQDRVELTSDSDLDIEENVEEHALALDETPFDLTLKAVAPEPELETITEPQSTSVQRYIDALETKQDRVELTSDSDLDIEENVEEHALALDETPFDLTLKPVAPEPELETITESQSTSVQRYIDALETKQESVELEFNSDINIEHSAEEQALELEEYPIDLTLEAVAPEPELETISEPQPTSVPRYIDALETKQESLGIQADELSSEDTETTLLQELASISETLELDHDFSEPELTNSIEASEIEMSEYDELLEIFHAEAQQHLTTFKHAFEASAIPFALNKELLRAAHSLKGCANIAQVTPVALIATELDQSLRTIYEHGYCLDSDELLLLQQTIEAIHQIIEHQKHPDTTEEPNLRVLSDNLFKITPRVNKIEPIIDPEFLIVYLEETDELLEQYSHQLANYRTDPNNEAYKQSVNDTLMQLADSSRNAKLATIAELYDLLAQIINYTNSSDNQQGFKLLEDGFEHLNDQIDRVIQNQAATDIGAFQSDVENYIAQQTSSIELPDIAATTLFAIPTEEEDLLQAFTEECGELLESSGNAIKQWQNNPNDVDAAMQLQRDLHTLKGGSRLTGITPIADLAHQTESLVLLAVEHKCEANEDFFRLLQRCQDRMADMQDLLAQQSPIAFANDLIDEITEYAERKPDIDESVSVVTDDVDKESELQPSETQSEQTKLFQIPTGDTDLLEAFTEECAELLESSGNAIRNWRQNPSAHDAPMQLQRDLHTLKGGSRLTGITPIADLTHQTESLVSLVIDHKDDASNAFFTLLQRCQDRLAEMQEALAQQASIPFADDLLSEIATLSGQQSELSKPQADKSSDVSTDYVAQLANTQPVEVPATPQQPAHVEQVRVRSDLLDFLTNFAGEVNISRDRVSQHNTEIRQQLSEMEATVERLQDQLRNLEIETETQILFRYEGESTKRSEFDPLELDRFSMIQQLSRGLTESVSDLNDITSSLDSLVRDSDAILLQQSRLSTDIQQGLMNTRLLPFSGLVPRLERIVRQTNETLGKASELTVYGAERELDRSILDRIIAPIEHILRNAIGHGIETPEQRVNSGKKPSGQLNLTITRDGSEILITLADDGRGIDVEKIRQKALNQNLINPDNMPNDEELIQLILTSGFSTADGVSQLAGRGVGMDVVSNEIRALKGRLSIQSVFGQGTTFSIRLPLTLSIMQALLVSSYDQQYAIPLAAVHAGERITVANVKTILAQEGEHRYEFNGTYYQFIALAQLLHHPFNLPEDLSTQLPLLLFRYGDKHVALLVDSINSNREIVLKSVGPQLGQIDAINGATIMGDGQVAFVLDIPTLIEDANLSDLPSKELSEHSGFIESEQVELRTPIAMVVDDSITMRKASGNLLKRHGFDVITARDGIDAVALINEQKPDVILLDVEMPRMDGFEFATVVRNDPETKSLPIIMITSRTGDKHRDRASDIGVNAYMGKPYQESELVQTLQDLLGDIYPNTQN